eukprot:gene26238-34859_t
MNSWSPTWNVDGTFEISWDVFIERQFRFEVFNIFWTEADLSETEKNAYRDFVARAGNNIGHDVFPAEPDRLHYVCPTCREQVWVGNAPIVREFYGSPCFECRQNEGATGLEPPECVIL